MVVPRKIVICRKNASFICFANQTFKKVNMFQGTIILNVYYAVFRMKITGYRRWIVSNYA